MIDNKSFTTDEGANGNTTIDIPRFRVTIRIGTGSTYSDPGLLSGGSRHGLWSEERRGNFSGCAGRTMVGVPANHRGQHYMQDQRERQREWLRRREILKQNHTNINVLIDSMSYKTDCVSNENS